jgi:hypothetical protein
MRCGAENGGYPHFELQCSLEPCPADDDTVETELADSLDIAGIADAAGCEELAVVARTGR